MSLNSKDNQTNKKALQAKEKTNLWAKQQIEKPEKFEKSEKARKRKKKKRRKKHE